MGKVRDLTGQKFGFLTVLRQGGLGKWGEARWEVLCECGNIINVSLSDLTRKRHPVRSCGCQRKSRLIDLSGQTFHYLTVLERAENNAQGKPQWLCQCICGKQVVVSTWDLLDKKYPTKSCGCMRNQLIGEAQKTHGMSYHPAFAVWHSMKQRCLDTNHHAYHNYGGRGITVCDRWLESFENFWNDMGASWQKGLELDRIDNNKGYSPENCRWGERKLNARNRRTNRTIDSPLGRMSVSELAERTGIGETTLLYRLDHDWPTESLCIKPDARNVCTTSGIVVRGTDLPSGIQELNVSGL